MLVFVYGRQVICSKCKFKNDSSDKYCINCAHSLHGKVTCSNCQFKDNDPSDEYCLNCAKPLFEKKTSSDQLLTALKKNYIGKTSKFHSKKDEKDSKVRASFCSSNPVARGKAILQVAQQGRSGYSEIPRLIRMIEDEGKIRITMSYSSPSYSYFVNSSNTTVGDYAIYVLYEIGQAVYIPLMKALNYTHAQNSRRRMMKLLARLQNPLSFDFMLKSLKLERDFENRIFAIKYFEEMGDKRCLPALLNAIKKEIPKVQIAIAEVFTKMPDKKMVPVLLTLLTNRNSKVVQSVLNTLGVVGDKSVTKDIIKLLEYTKDTSVQQSALETLEAFGDPNAVKSIIKAFRNPQLKGRASRALLRCVNSSSIPSLVKMLKSRDPYTFKEGVIAMIKLKNPQTLPFLLPLVMSNKNDDLRTFIVADLGDMQNEKVRKALIYCVKKDKLSVIRKIAAKNLRWHDDSYVLDVLIDVMKNDLDKKVRRQAASTIFYSSNKQKALDAFREALKKDKDPIFRQNAKTFIHNM